MINRFSKESLAGCLQDFGNTICSLAEKIADLAISGRTKSLIIDINIEVGEAPNMSIIFDQYADEIRIPWNGGIESND